MNEDKATRYHRHKRRAALVSLGWTVALLFGLLASPLGPALAALARALAELTNPPALFEWTWVVLYVGGLSLLHELGGLPVRFYEGYLLERRYGLSEERRADWAAAELKSFVLGLFLSAVAGTVVYASIRWSPEGWWLPAGVLFAAAYIALGGLAPAWLLPLFYRVRPLDREPLGGRLRALAERAGARAVEIHEWSLGARTRKANAFLAGIGSTRRVLVSDTLLDRYTDDEIEVVLAHELAHHRYADIWKGLAVEAAIVVAGFRLAAWVLVYAQSRALIDVPSNVAGLPLVLLVVGGVWVAARPAANAVSRSHERRADRFALALTQNPGAFVSLVRRLAVQNLSEEQPSTLVRWCFYSHPPTADRIATARVFQSAQGRVVPLPSVR